MDVLSGHRPEFAAVIAEALAEPGTELRPSARHSVVVCTADDSETCADRLATTSELVWLGTEPTNLPCPVAMLARWAEEHVDELGN